MCSTEREVNLCEGGKQVIRCDNQEIDIISAFWGRTDREDCKAGLDWMVAWAWKVNCDASDALEVARGECEGLSSCEVHETVSQFGDSCFGTKKYLKVSYHLC